MRIIAGAVLGALALAAASLPAAAPPSSALDATSSAPGADVELFQTVQDIITSENALTLDTAASPGKKPPRATVQANKKLDKRKVLKHGVRESNRAAGTRFTTVESSFVLKEVQATGGSKVLIVDELTRYPMPDGQHYEYRVEHRATFAQSTDGWTIADLTTDSPVSEVGETALAAAGENPAGHVAAGVARVRHARAALEGNREVLRAVDDTKAADRGVALADEESAAAGSTSVDPGPSDLARPSQAPAEISARGLSVAPGQAAGDGIPPYEYSTMVTWAKWYAKDHPVTYTRDANDCTTFVSWAMWKGGWAEAGAQDYPSVAWNRDDDDVWYWRCNTCDPRHSYTWGGAINWYRFAYFKTGRVRHLAYVTDLAAAADVLQMEVDGYGSTNNADHTMLTTGRNSAGWVLLSYHSTDTLNKPLNLILSANNGPYWAWRT